VSDWLRGPSNRFAQVATSAASGPGVVNRWRDSDRRTKAAWDPGTGHRAGGQQSVRMALTQWHSGSNDSRVSGAGPCGADPDSSRPSVRRRQSTEAGPAGHGSARPPVPRAGRGGGRAADGPVRPAIRRAARDPSIKVGDWGELRSACGPQAAVWRVSLTPARALQQARVRVISYGPGDARCAIFVGWLGGWQ